MKNLNKLGLLFIVIHTAIVILIVGENFEGSWGGFFLFILDFPVSLLMLIPIDWNRWMLFGVIGALWWYLVGVVITIAVRKKIAD